VDGLQQVVEGLHLERSHGVVIERRREHDARCRRGTAQDIEAVSAGHLHVEQAEIRPLTIEQLDRRADVAGLAGDLDERDRGQQASQAVARRLLVVDDRHAEVHTAAARIAPRSTPRVAGRVMRASAPRPWGAA
jgi:hypothetical protein